MTVALIALLVAVRGVAEADRIAGRAALLGARSLMTATLDAVPAGRDPLARHLTFGFRTIAGGSPIRRFDVDMTKRMHLVIVGDDLRSFAHVHPVLHPDGRFTLDQRFAAPARYHLYADVMPTGLGHQVERFDLSVDGGSAARHRDLAPTAPRVRAGPYVVVLDRVGLRAGRENRIAVDIRRGGEPAHDLRSYLGARAHAVLVDAATLGYLHVHAQAASDAEMEMGMNGAMAMPALRDGVTVAPTMILRIAPDRAGAYVLWLQFRGASRVYVARFVLDVER
jgi:hypothetical protein